MTSPGRLLANLDGASATVEDLPWWYGFRQIDPRPPGRGVGSGPYRARKEALRFYDSAKVHRDAHVISPFQARDRAEADAEAERVFKSWPAADGLTNSAGVLGDDPGRPYTPWSRSGKP